MKLRNVYTIFSLALLFLVLSQDNVIGQITIEETIITDRFDGIYREVLYETDLDIDGQLQEIKLAIGDNQVWNFSDFNYVDSTVILYEYMYVDMDDPFLMNPNLERSNFIQKQTFLPIGGGVQDTFCQFLYATLENGEWSVNGSLTIADIDLNGEVDTFLQWLDPPVIEAQFPVTVNSEWHSTSTLNQIFMGMEFASTVMIDSNMVVGSGTLITPKGSQEALRIHNKHIDNPIGSPITDISNSIDFVTEDEAVTASIVVEDGRAFYATKKKVGGSTSTAALPLLSFTLGAVYPNPVQQVLSIPITMEDSGIVDFMLRDMNGRLLKAQTAKNINRGFSIHDMELEDLPLGMYWIEVKHKNQTQVRKITKVN